jgi:hypothetical protein
LKIDYSVTRQTDGRANSSCQKKKTVGCGVKTC